MRRYGLGLFGALIALGLGACETPPPAASEQELASAQTEYLRYYTPAELLAQVEAEAKQQKEQPPAPAPAPRTVAMAKPVPPPAPPAPAVVEMPAVMSPPAPAPKPAPTVVEAKPAPKPRIPVIKPLPKPQPSVAQLSGLPWIDILFREPTVDNAMAVLKDMTRRDEAAQVEALRILCSRRPANGQQEMFITAFTHVSPFVREVAISALLRAYADTTDAWGRRLLETRGGREEDRYNLARIVIRNKAKEAYPLAIEALGSDFSGGALFHARREILEAGYAIVASLSRLALRQKKTDSGVIARRLYRWLQNAGGIKEAYYDTVNRAPSEYTVILFRERYGETSRPLLEQALVNADSNLAGHIRQALEDLHNPDAALVPKPHREYPNMIYMITYNTPSGIKRVLSDTPIWPHQEPGQINEHEGIHQKAILEKPDSLNTLRNLPSTRVKDIVVDGVHIDQLDMQVR